jgi:glucose/arabinose dehydrogenase
VPAGVTAAAQSASSILVSWTASTDTSGISGYRVFRDGGATAVGTVQTTSFTDTGLAASTAYSYTVVAVDAAATPNVSAASAAANATTQAAVPTDTTPPTVPAGVTAAAQTSSSIRVSWTASTDASGISAYRIFRNGGATAVASVQTTSFTDTGLAPTTAYSYTVVAVDAATPPNVSAASAAASATTPAAPPVRIGTQRVFSGLTLFAAHSLLRVPHDTTRWVVVQQDGHILSFADTPAVSATSSVLDISDRVVFRNVHGLLGLAFHPNYPTDTRAYVAYTHEVSSGVIVLRISAFTTGDGGATLNPASEQIIFEMAQPGGHNNGGHLLFGPDGFLYLGIGDGGNDDSATGVAGNGQLTNNLLGKILRIDVSGSTGTRPYRIPADNPFAANPLCNMDGTGAQDCPEIFAWGFRNPWRWSFDSQGGQLWLGDVGSHTREEVDRVVLGGNYGWRCFEGTLQTTLNCGTPTTPLLPPVAEYVHPVGQSVVGGFVYHGTAIPGLVGRYVFADYNLGQIWNIATDTAPTRTVVTADSWQSGLNPASFAQDNDGELFIVDVRTASIYKIVPAN